MRVEALLDRHRYDATKKAVKALLAKGKLTADQRCRAFFSEGTELLKQSSRDDAREPDRRRGEDCCRHVAILHRRGKRTRDR